MKYLLKMSFLLMPLLVVGQNQNLSIFEPLIGKTWEAEGKWGDGSKFFQKTTFQFSLEGTIVVAKSIGFVDETQTKLGLRNHGIRQYDKKSDTIKFWEFDVFGGLTQGHVYGEGKNIVYRYRYGNATITDKWVYVNDSTYRFKVGEYKDGKWIKTYLSTQFKAQAD